MFCGGQFPRRTPAGRRDDCHRAVLLTRMQVVGLRIIPRIAQQSLDADDLRGIVQQRFEILVIRPRAAVGMKAQGDVAQALAENRELGVGGLLVLCRLFRLLFLLFRLVLAFAEMVRGLAVLQAGGVQGRVLDPLFQELFFRANSTVDSSKDLAEESLSNRLDAFWIVV